MSNATNNAHDQDLNPVQQDSLRVCDQPIFVIGSPRSGTTALARALGTHPELWTSHESYFLNGLFGDGRAEYVYQRQSSRNAPGWLLTENVERSEFLAYVGAGLNALFTSRSGGRRWIDQTPRYTLIVDDLADLFPNAVFLHMLRDGRATVHSMMNFEHKFTDRPQAARHLPDWVGDFDAACEAWVEYVTHADGFCHDHPQRCLKIVNKTLSQDPTGGFAQIHEFLGVPDHSDPSELFANTRINSSFTPGDEASTYHNWTRDQRATFTVIAGPAMIELGLCETDELHQWALQPATTTRHT